MGMSTRLSVCLYFCRDFLSVRQSVRNESYITLLSCCRRGKGKGGWISSLLRYIV